MKFSADPHVKIMTALGNNFLHDAFGYFYGFGIGLNGNLYKFKSNQIDAKDLIKAYEDGENMLGTVEFNFNKSKQE